MSDLNERISVWRASLGQRLGPKPAAELEDHLRTIIESLATTGLPEEERLLVASHRLGHPDALSAEFAKNDPFATWRRSLVWMLVGLVPLSLLLNAVQSLVLAVATTSLNWGWPPWAAASTYFAASALLLFASLGSCLWAGKATQLFRCTPARWLPTTFSGRAGMLAIMVVALHLEPLIISRYSSLASGSPAILSRNMEFFSFIQAYSIGCNCLYLSFDIGAAILIAWLVSSRRVETEAA
jgi:hypothetical protein